MATGIITSYVSIVDSNGMPYPRSGIDTSCRVFVCEPGTTTLMSVFSDDDLLVAAANPITVTAGRHAQRFIANQAYKLVVEINGTTTIGSGTTLSSWGGDNIDPGISVGTGSQDALLGVAGVGSIGAFRTLILAPAQSEMDSATTNIANHATWMGYTLTTKSRMATGTTAQEPAAGTAGSYRFNTTTVVPYVDNGSAWKRIAIEGKLNSSYFEAAAGRWMLQRVRRTTLANASTSTAIPYDTTAPQITEGVQAFANEVFTPLSASSVIRIKCRIVVECNTADTMMTIALHKNAATSAIAVATGNISVVSGQATPFLEYEESPGSTSAITYRINCGPSAGTATFNGANATLGALHQSYLEIEEWLQL